MRSPNPWARIGTDWPAVHVVRSRFDSPFLHAETRWKRGRPTAVLLNRDLTQVQARCAVAHECEHLDRGQPCKTLLPHIERQVVRATAHYLLPDLVSLVEAVMTYDLRRAADELWVTYPVLLDRLRTLTDRELRLVRTAV